MNAPLIEYRIEGPYLHQESQQEYWISMYWIPGTSFSEASSFWTKAECLERLNGWAKYWTNKSLADQCECGSRKLYAPFAPGHANWCPVTPHNVRPPKPRPSKP